LPLQIDRNAFVRWAERVRVRLLLYFRWVIYSEEEALLASKYLRFLALLEEREQALLAPAVQEVSLVRPASDTTLPWTDILQYSRMAQCHAHGRYCCCAVKVRAGGRAASDGVPLERWLPHSHHKCPVSVAACSGQLHCCQAASARRLVARCLR
jgi:hypothetical protein